MRALERIRKLESITDSSMANYTTDYEYDSKERIIKRTVTGGINAVTSYEYDGMDNITREIHIADKKKTTKTFGYNDKGQIVSVAAVVEDVV